MIHYEVNLELDPSIMADFMTWLPDHIEEVLRIQGFKNAHIFEDTDHTQKIIVIYELESLTELQNYFDHYAKEMREKTSQRFGEKVRATRRALSLTKRIEKI